MGNLTISQWQTIAISTRDRAERVQKMIRERARAACREAGLDPGLLGIHPHNAMVSLHYGKPWPGINYSKVRLCLRLLEKQWEPCRLADAYVSRKFKEVSNG